jgi:hypothetical protein
MNTSLLGPFSGFYLSSFPHFGQEHQLYQTVYNGQMEAQVALAMSGVTRCSDVSTEYFVVIFQSVSNPDFERQKTSFAVFAVHFY